MVKTSSLILRTPILEMFTVLSMAFRISLKTSIRVFCAGRFRLILMAGVLMEENLRIMRLSWQDMMRFIQNVGRWLQMYLDGWLNLF
jgi:hypothetical protein